MNYSTTFTTSGNLVAVEPFDNPASATWTNPVVVTGGSPGHALGPGSASTNDSIARKTGVWGPNHTVTGTHFIPGAITTAEAELHGRMTITTGPDAVTTYEDDYINGGNAVQCARWDSTQGTFVTIGGGFATGGLIDGDVSDMVMGGTNPSITIQHKKNGVSLGTDTDSSGVGYNTGNPGIGLDEQANAGAWGWKGWSATDGLSSDVPTNIGPFKISRAGTGPRQTRRLAQVFPDVTAFPPAFIFNQPQPPMRKGQGPGFRGPRGRLKPQLFADTTPGIVAKVGQWTWAGLAASIAVSISTGIGPWTWSGKASPLAVQISAKVGQWTWSGKASPLAKQVVGKIGQWTWAGQASPLEAQVLGKIGQWNWAGINASLGGPTNVNASIGAWTWAGLSSPLAGLTPVVTPTGSGGGGRYFGYYPERKREIKAEIRAIVREKKAIERRLQIAPSNADLGRLADLLTELQARLNALVTEYEELIHVWQAETQRQEVKEEDEEFLIQLFSESFYE